ncbi:hypothetical protein NYQ10_18020 [Flavobacterium johnsoniae]|uniref:hypothetical protein n=1 Tax=Flavobacterium johnsoniae TaxID=986 RepID=UPI0025B1B9DD|nr:hypothetical protein [Flavobacterium johnsoniae]WJS93987.1 hypothetical protein NYQ10_18020 [Flavobacterium johnsoniae]
MEKEHNHEYGQYDPDYIDQNTLVDGTLSNEDQYKQDLKKHENREFGESDPDYYEQNTPVDNDNYARDEDPYQYQEEFIEDPKHPQVDFEKNINISSENIPNEERIINEDDAITNDDTESDLNDDYDPDLDSENDEEKHSDLDDDEELDDFDAEHFPENHPRE